MTMMMTRRMTMRDRVQVAVLAVLVVLGSQWVAGAQAQAQAQGLAPGQRDMTISSWQTVDGTRLARVTAAVMVADRGLFFSSGTPPTLYEFLLPPSGPMQFVDKLPISDEVVHAFVHGTSSTSSSSYEVYVGGLSSDKHYISKYTITPGTQPSVMSTVNRSSEVVFPGPISSMVMANDYVYVSVNAQTPGYIMRVPLSNFTTAYVQEHPFITIPDDPALQFATYDGRYVYFASGKESSLPKVYRVDTLSFTLDSTITLSSGSGSQGSFIDTARGLLYVVSGGRPNTLLKVNTSTFQQIQALEFEIQTTTRAVLYDSYGGHVFFGHALEPGVVSHINLQDSEIQPTLYFPANMGHIASGVLDATNHWAYFGILINSSFTVVKIQLPLPCVGKYSNISGTGSDNCSYPNGYCEYATCQCYADSEFEGVACSDRKCLNDCHRNATNNTDGTSHGTCLNGVCQCSADYTGNDCGIRRCANECSGRGNCTGAPDFVCQCPIDWTGDDCSEYITIPSCDRLHTCGQCGRNSSCGWCESSNECVEGDEFGPMHSLCERYNYSMCPSLFYFSFGYILTIICWLFMVVSAIVTIWQDYTLPENTKAKRFVIRFWWRNQLAAKTWQLVEYVQLLAITGYLAVDMPPSYLEFVLPFQWSVFHLPYPFSDASVIRPPTNLNDNSFFVQGRVVHSAAHEVFLGNLFFYAIMIAAIFILFLFVSIVAACSRDSRDKLSNMGKNRSLYSVLRLNQFAYLPLTVTALFTIIWYSHTNSHSSSFTASVALSVIVLAVLGLAVPIITFLKIYKKEKELFSVAFSMKYGSLYQKYHFRKGFFTTVQFAKSLVVAIWVGILYQHPVPQLIMLAVTHIVYFVIVVVGKPHADHIHFFTELVVTALEVILFFLFLGFRSHEDASGWAVGVVVIHILAISVIVVGICSTIFKMNGIGSVGELKDAVSSKDKNKLSEDMTGLQKEHRVSSSSSVSL